MMRLSLLIAAMVLSGCTAALADDPAASPDHPSRDGRCIGDTGRDDFDRSEQACLRQIGGMAERHGPGLQLKFRNGLTKVYLNEEAKCQSAEADGCITYRLTGYFPKHDLILIEVGHWEGVSWLLVRAENGNASEIVAPPHYSPSERWLASVASSVGPSGPLNGIDIVPAISDPSVKEWHYRVPDEDPWLYEFAGWDGDDRVKLTATSTETPERHLPAAVARRNGTWQLNAPK